MFCAYAGGKTHRENTRILVHIFFHVFDERVDISAPSEFLSHKQVPQASRLRATHVNICDFICRSSFEFSAIRDQ